MITNSEKYKMKDSTGRDTITKWFNTELFNINGEPLKFHLEGYDEIEFCNLVKIIEAYGGELSEPTGDTIIFSEPDHPAGIHQRYNLKYLRDSILVNELLELEQYELPLAANHHHWDVENCGDVLDKEETLEKKFTTSTKVKRERADNADDRASIMSRDSSSGEDASGAARTRPSIFLRKRKINEEKPVKEGAEKKKLCKRDNSPHKKFVLRDEDPISPNKRSEMVEEASLDNQSSHEPVENKRRSYNSFTAEEKRQMIQYLVDKNAINRGKFAGIWKEMIADLKITHRSADAFRDQFSRCLNKNYEQYTEDVDIRKKLEQVYSNRGCKNSFTKEENRQMIKFLIENDAISRATDIATWEEMVASNKINQTANNLRYYFIWGLRHNYKQYTKDVHALEEFEKINNDIARDRKFYTEEEEREMIQYLIDKKSIHRANGRIIWKRMAADKITHRTAYSLHAHFLYKLRYKYKKYTEDAEAREEFEKLLEPRYAEYHRWTETENQAIIDYLIENDVIHRANGEFIWRKLSKEAGILENCKAKSLYNHFQRALRYNYRKYTSDPEALAKFAAIEKKKRVVE